MQRNTAFILTFLLSLVFTSCLTNNDVENNPTLVVEGWIDDGGFPIVILTTTIPVTEKTHEVSELGNYLLRWARVTVSDEEHEVVLTGKVDHRYFPPFIYTSSDIVGQVGKTYKLTVSYKDFYAEAETTIPQAPILDSLHVVPCADSDTLYQIYAYFNDDLKERRYYKFFTCMGKYSQMPFSSYMQTMSNEVFASSEELEASVYKGRVITESGDYVPYFAPSDSVIVKFASMDSISFVYWNQMEHNMTLGGLPMTSVAKNPVSNIRGGLGYWCGYGATFYSVIISDYIQVRP